jgi:hypothetical protein
MAFGGGRNFFGFSKEVAGGVTVSPRHNIIYAGAE